MNDPENVFDVISAIQQGDFDVVHQAIELHHITATAQDQEGCSLLHWAAINNRCAIANMLIDQGADVNVTGGLLGETPLLWAARKSFYAMIQLLISRGGNLSIKSTQGLDAVHMSVREKDFNLLFVLLHFGADPNSTDKEGLTPLLWLLKSGGRNNVSLLTRKEGAKLRKPIRFLLRHGADVLLEDPITQNNALHLMASNREYDSRSAFLIHNTTKNIIIARNESDETPFKLANHSMNRGFTQFLCDALLFGSVPYHFVTFISALTIVSAYLLNVKFGLIWGSVYWFILFVILRNCMQWTLVDHQGRYLMGAFLGFTTNTLLSLSPNVYMYSTQERISVYPYTTPTQQVAIFTSFSLFIYYYFKLHMTKPKYATPTDKSVLVSRIVSTSSTEGPDNENGEKKDSLNINTCNGIRNKFRFCGVCSVDLTESAECSHCEACGVCVLGLDGHYQFLGNCVGRGNRRLYCVFLIFASLYFFTFSYLSLIAHSESTCKSSTHALSFLVLIYHFCETEICTAKTSFSSFLMTWLSMRLSMHFANALSIQMMLITRRSTLHYAIRGLYSEANLSVKENMRSITDFWLRGTYVISASTYSPVHKHTKNMKTSSNVETKRNEMTKRRDKDNSKGREEGKEKKEKKEKKKCEKELYIYDVEVGTNREKEKKEEEEEEEEELPLINDENENENFSDDECEGNLLYTHRLQQMKYWSRNSDEIDVTTEDDLSARTQIPSIRASDR